MLDVKDLPVIYTAWRNRYHNRDNRMELIDRVVTGDFGVFDPEDEPIESRSPNFVQVALEDTAEAASLMPTLRVEPSGVSSGAKKRAVTMERVGTSYLDISKMDLLVPQTVMDMAAFGYGVWVVWPRFDLRAPVIERRDPRTCYPELGHRPGDPVERAFFCRQIPYASLPENYKIILSNYLANNARVTSLGTAVQENIDVVLVEWFDQEEMVVAALYQASGAMMTGTPTPTSYIPVELERIPNKTGMCPVVIGSRFSIDGEFRGQFDQVIGVLNAHIRLTGMLLDYADQAVYSDIWVKDLIGEMPFGGGAYIELGPQGSIGRVAPAVSSLNVQQDLANLVEGFHVGGRWPKSRPGEIDQCLAPDTKVLTEDLLWVPVGELKEGERLVAFDEHTEPGKTRRFRTSEVTHVGRASLPSYRVTMADGTVFTASEGHQWLVRNNARHPYWTTTEEMFKRFQRGNLTTHAVKVMDTWEPEDTYEAGYVSGMFDGEGHLSRPTARGGTLTLGFAQRDNAALAAVEIYAESLGIDLQRYGLTGQNGDVYQAVVRGGRVEVLNTLGRVRPKRLISKFQELGGADCIGQLTQSTVDVVDIEFIGDHEVVTLGTSTKTLIAEGYAHHNSIASAKFLESSAGMMNTAIRTYHMLLKHMMEQSLRVCFELDRKLFPGEKVAGGILRNQQFLVKYETKDIDPESRLRVEYGLGLGKDPSQSAVLMIQYAKEKYISREFVQENIDGLTDVERERRRIDVEQLQDMALAEILTGLQNQQIPQDALVKIAQARANGENLFDLFQKYIVQPKQDNAENGLQSGMTGQTLPPGPPGQAALPTPGGPPMPGPTPPPPPANPLEAANRLSIPLPGRTGFLSTQT